MKTLTSASNTEEKHYLKETSAKNTLKPELEPTKYIEEERGGKV